MDKTERLPKNLLTSVFSVYFCDVFRTRDTKLRDTGQGPWPVEGPSRVSCPEVSSQKNAYESNTKITHPNDPRAWRDAVLVRLTRETRAAGSGLI